MYSDSAPAPGWKFWRSWLIATTLVLASATALIVAGEALARQTTSASQLAQTLPTR